MHIVAVTSQIDFASRLARSMRATHGRVVFLRFRDGELYGRLVTTVRGTRVLVIGATAPPDENLLQTLFLIDACRRAGARRIDVLIPYFGYARQDRVVARGEAVGREVVIRALKAAGADDLVSLDVHGRPLVDRELHSDELLAREFVGWKNVVVVAADEGAIARARRTATILRSHIAVIHKTRPKPGAARATKIIGDVRGKNALIVDDMIDSAGTIVEAVRMLRRHGARDIAVAATHAVFSGPAVRRLRNLRLARMVVTDTIPLPKSKRFPGLKTLGVIPLLASQLRG